MKWMVTILFTWILMICPAGAELSVPGLEAVWEYGETYNIPQDQPLEEGLVRLFDQVPSMLGDFLSAGLRTGLKLLCVVLVCALGQGFEASGTGSALSGIRLAGALSITALTMTDVAAIIGLGRETIGRIDLFSGVLLPVMGVLSALSGSITASALRQGATVLFSKLLVSAIDSLLVPLVYAYVAVSCARAAANHPGLDRLAQGIKSVVTGCLNILLVVFVGYLTAGGAIAGSVDASRIKAAKMAISRSIPVVGGILADASEAVLAGAGVLRSSVGVVGLLVVLAICMAPFLHLAAQYIIYKAVAAVCACVAQPEFSRLIDAIGSAFGLILGMTGASALILLIGVVSAVLGVTG